MASLSETVAALERLAPSRFALGFDKVGLQISPGSRTIHRIVVSLDRSLAAVERAVELGAELLVTHHPLIFRPIERIGDDYEGRAIRRLIGNGIGHFAAHTNWDAAQGGINDALAARLGLQDATSFGMGMEVTTMKMVVFVPEASVDRVLDAAAEAGAGQIGAYQRCAFVTQGEGRFDAPPLGRPVIGEPGQRNGVPEVRLEMVLPTARQASVARAVRAAHPYEEPAIDFAPLAPRAEQPLGRLGRLDPVRLEDLVATVDQVLTTKSLAWGNPAAVITRVAVEGGAADGDWKAARRAGAQVLITGEVKQHIALEASESDFALIQAGHYATEQPGVEDLGAALAKAVPDVEVSVFEPAAGTSGRPFWRTEALGSASA